MGALQSTVDAPITALTDQIVLLLFIIVLIWKRCQSLSNIVSGLSRNKFEFGIKDRNCLFAQQGAIPLPRLNATAQCHGSRSNCHYFKDWNLNSKFRIQFLGIKVTAGSNSIAAAQGRVASSHYFKDLKFKFKIQNLIFRNQSPCLIVQPEFWLCRKEIPPWVWSSHEKHGANLQPCIKLSFWS